MNILCIGDVIGRPGRHLLQHKLRQIVETENIEFVIANVENSAGGFGVTEKIAKEFLDMGVDVLTSGNHINDKKEIHSYLAQPNTRLLRPLNYEPKKGEPQIPGGGVICTTTRKGKKIAVLNVMGRVNMKTELSPFTALELVLPQVHAHTSCIIVDSHAEATSEKMAIGWFLDGKVSAVVGTHTHIPTADERIFPQGTAYLTDIGMTGPFDSVVGMKVDIAMHRFLTGDKKHMEIASENLWLNGVIISIDDHSGKAQSIKRIQYRNCEL